MRVLGAVLAGGRSSRFGSDKAAALLDGRSLLDHVVERLRPFVGEVVVCGRTVPDLRCLDDRPAAGLGPLGGICAALADARVRGYDAVLTMPCDAPLLPDDAVMRLFAAGVPAYVANLPVVGLWPSSAAEALEGLLGQPGSHAVRRWASGIGAHAVTCEAIPNVNTPGDLAALQDGGR